MDVKVKDARRLSPQAQEDLRRRAGAAVKNGMSQAAGATVVGGSPKTGWRWGNALDSKGNKGLKAGQRGRRPGEQKALTAQQEAWTRRAVLGKNPERLALPGLVWTPSAGKGLGAQAVWYRAVPGHD